MLNLDWLKIRAEAFSSERFGVTGLPLAGRYAAICKELQDLQALRDEIADSDLRFTAVKQLKDRAKQLQRTVYHQAPGVLQK